MSRLITKTERLAELERIRIEEEAAAAAIEEAKRKEEEELVLKRKQREEERENARRAAELQRQREEEAEAHRLARRAEQSKGVDPVAPAWRRSTPSNTSPSTPISASTPPRSGSPAPAATAAPGKYRPGAFKASRTTDPTAGRPASPAPAKDIVRVSRSGVDSQKEDDSGAKPWRSSRASATTIVDETHTKSEDAPRQRLREDHHLHDREEPARGSSSPLHKDSDGFQTVEKKGIWKSSRARGKV
jgi:translation initiation factor 3 subunit A